MLRNSHECIIPTSLECCDPTNDVGDHSNDTTNYEPVPSHAKQQCVPTTTVESQLLALRRLNRFNKPGSIECEVLKRRNSRD